MKRLLCALLVLVPASAADAQSVTEIATEGAVTAIVQTPRGTYAETERGTVRLEQGDCPGGLCATPDVIRGLPQRAPEGALPDGFVDTSASGDIRRAWYGRPTDRYGHGVLGDAVEGGSLVVETATGERFELTLPETQVFEDITPRIVDLDIHEIPRYRDVPAHLPGISAWLDEAALANTPPAIALDVDGDWPAGPFDAVYSANTAHIMSLARVESMFRGVGALLAQGKLFVLYGPFSDHGRHSSDSNARFDAYLRAHMLHPNFAPAADGMARLRPVVRGRESWSLRLSH